MTRHRAWLPCGLVAMLVSCVAIDARAGTDGVLFLGIFQKNAVQDRAGRAVLKRMERMGERALPVERLSPGERICRSQECLTTLATARGVDWILGGELRQAEGHTFTVAMWLWDARAGKLREGDVQTCPACDEETLGNAISTATGQILERRAAVGRTTRENPPAQTPPPDAIVKPDQPPLLPNPTKPPRYSRGHLIAIGTLAAGTLAALGTSVLFSTVKFYGGTSCGLPPPTPPGIVCDYQPQLMGAGYAATAVLATGLVLSISLP